VGHYPVLKPGQMFEYASGTSLELESGTGLMKGSFQMTVLDENGKQTEEVFDAHIGPVVLSPSVVLQE
jgi:uncharacterized protein affecting Mg2+/Co2+ transport